jgi:hypothetical protein
MLENVVNRNRRFRPGKWVTIKGSTMLATMQSFDSTPSFRRPSVSDDHAFAESLFRHLKSPPTYPRHGFGTLEEARAWVDVCDPQPGVPITERRKPNDDTESREGSFCNCAAFWQPRSRHCVRGVARNAELRA